MKLPWRYILISMAVGLLIGVAGGLFFSHRMTGPWTEKKAERFLRRLDNELKLSEPQRAQIHIYLSTNRDKLAAYQEDIRKTTRAEIRALMNPEQQMRFDAMVARHDAKRQKREGH